MTDKSYAEQPHLHTDAPFRAASLIYPGNLAGAMRQAQADQAKTLFGVAQGIPSVFLTKVLASTKPDFIWMDLEHGMYNRLELHDAIHAAQHHSEGKTMVIVRVPKNDDVYLSTALDAGAAGIVIPHCETAAEVRDKIKDIFYPPLGQRSFSPWVFTPGVSDASLYDNDPFNMTSSNKHVVVIPQIESVRGVENLDEIAALPGVGALMFGPGDFSADAGLELKLGGTPHPTLVAAMMKLSATAQKHNLSLMGAAQAPEMIPMLISQGYNAIAVFFDVWDIARKVKGSVDEARLMAENLARKAGETATNGDSNDKLPSGHTNGTAEQIVEDEMLAQ